MKTALAFGISFVLSLQLVHSQERFETFRFDTAREECRMHIRPYLHTVAWADGSVLEISASSGCSARLGRAYELAGNVRLRLRNGESSKELLSVLASNAALDFSRKRLIIPASASISWHGRLVDVPGLALNWSRRETKSVNGFYARW